jgi:hypothetical protein
MKPGTPPLQSARLLDQVHERVRYLHYSLKTGKAYLHWIRFFINWMVFKLWISGNQYAIKLIAIHAYSIRSKGQFDT